MDEFNIALAWGRWWETVLADFLKTQGWHIIRLGDIKTARGGPRAEGQFTETILTDLIRVKDGISRFCEAKLKDSPVLWKFGNELREGIDKPYWDDYCRLQAQSGIPGDICIIELSRNEADSRAHIYNPRILLQSISQLTLHGPIETAPHPESRQPYGMVYWPVSAFEIIADNLDIVPPLTLGATLKQRLHGWTGTQNKSLRVPLRNRQPILHLCVVCGSIAAFGYGPPQWLLPWRWFCFEHRHIAEAEL